MEQKYIKEIVKEGSTPAYIFDAGIIKKKINSIKEKLGNNEKIQLCYAMKANPFLIKIMEPFIDKYEVCSPGELSICIEQNIDMNKIVLSGVNKEKEDIIRAMKWDCVFTVESRIQLKLIEECAKNLNKKVKVLLRLTSGNQFGLDKTEITDIIRQRKKFINLEVCGIQYFSGTQKKVKKIIEEMGILCSFCQELKQNYEYEAEVLEYGPGLGIDYFGKNEDVDGVIEKCKDAFEMATTAKLQLILEMGRFLAAECGSYLTQVVDVKKNNNQNYCIVDGGINHVNYYGQIMGVRVPPVRYYQMIHNYEEKKIASEDEACESICVCGSLCTVADVLIKKLPVEDVHVGDIFIFEKIGAYSVTEGIYLFLSRKMPKVYLLWEGGLELLRDSYETYQLNCGKATT